MNQSIGCPTANKLISLQEQVAIDSLVARCGALTPRSNVEFEMKLTLTGIAVLALAASVQTADAMVVGSLGGGGGPFLTLNSSGLNGGAVATLTGGTVYTSDQPFADIPSGGVSGGTFLAAGPTSGQPAVLTFRTPINYLSFLWGSPDTYNTLEITSTTGTYDFTVNSLGFAVTNGNQSFSQYVQFATNPGETILSASFANSPAQDAFETANFSVAAVPEASTWAMMIFGFMGIGLIAYRRSPKAEMRWV